MGISVLADPAKLPLVPAVSSWNIYNIRLFVEMGSCFVTQDDHEVADLQNGGIVGL
jgi:hypothetical protein